MKNILFFIVFLLVSCSKGEERPIKIICEKGDQFFEIKKMTQHECGSNKVRVIEKQKNDTLFIVIE